LRRHSLPFEPRGELRHPIVAPPHLLALVMVDRPLEDGRAGGLRGVRGPADVVGVEVRDEHRRHRAVELRQERRPLVGQAGQAEAGVDEQVAVVGRDEVPVHVPGLHRHRVGQPDDAVRELPRYERMFYYRHVGIEYREEPCRSALNRVKGMGFGWSLNPYMGCAHRCTFCYVRAFELRADRPSDDRYGTSIRVKVNVAEVLRKELSRPSWQGETVAIGAATDPYQPAEGRYRLTRGCIEALRDASNAFSLITRNPMIVRDLDVFVEASKRAQ